MSITVGSLILFSGTYEKSVTFYRALGLPLDGEEHGDGQVHLACDIGGVHVAVFDAKSAPARPSSEFRSPGSSYFGFTVKNVAEVLERLRALEAPVRQEPEMFPWGMRALVEDPDGRVIELFARH